MPWSPGERQVEGRCLLGLPVRIRISACSSTQKIRQQWRPAAAEGGVGRCGGPWPRVPHSTVHQSWRAVVRCHGWAGQGGPPGVLPMSEPAVEAGARAAVGSLLAAQAAVRLRGGEAGTMMFTTNVKGAELCLRGRRRTVAPRRGTRTNQPAAELFAPPASVTARLRQC